MQRTKRPAVNRFLDVEAEVDEDEEDEEDEDEYARGAFKAVTLFFRHLIRKQTNLLLVARAKRRISFGELPTTLDLIGGNANSMIKTLLRLRRMSASVTDAQPCAIPET